MAVVSRTAILAAWIALVAEAKAQEVPAAASPPSASPPPGIAAERLEALEKGAAGRTAEIEDLRRALDAERRARDADEAALEGRLAAMKTEAAIRPAAVTTRWPGLSLTGFAQMDASIRQSSEDQLNQSTGDPLNEDRFMLRRARLRVLEQVGVVEGALEFDGNTVKGPTARVVGMEASLRWPPSGSEPPLVMATVGSFKIPFGFEVVESDRDRFFLERSNMEHAFFPGEYDLGARLQGGWRFIRYALAAQNGEPLGEKSFPGRDPNRAKDFTGRVGVDLRTVSGFQVVAGFSALKGKGFHKGTPATKDVLVWRDLNEDGVVGPGEIQVIPGQIATPSENFDRFAMGADVRIVVPIHRLGSLMAYGELQTASNLDRGILPADPVISLRDLREQGFYAALVQELGPHLVAGARYDVYNPDVDARDTQLGAMVPTDASVSTLAVTVGWCDPHGRLLLEWDRNRNHFGRTVAGLPTNLQDDAWLLRAEMKF